MCQLSSPSALTASRSTELNTGDLLPDIDLLDERGQAMHLHDFRGKALAVSFIYLRCPLPTYCPLTNRNFQTASALLDRLGVKNCGASSGAFQNMTSEHERAKPKQASGYQTQRE